MPAWPGAWLGCYKLAKWTLTWGPGHGDKIKLNCFMTADKRQELCMCVRIDLCSPCGTQASNHSYNFSLEPTATPTATATATATAVSGS